MKTITTPFTYFNTRVFKSSSEKVLNLDFRFNAEYYEEDNSLSISSKIKFSPLSDIASVVFPGIFKRYLVDDIQHGIRFLTTSDMMMLEPESDKILSEHLTKNLPIYRVQDHTLLVSRSGSIGNTVYVDARLRDFAITEDALRVRPFDSRNMGLLYFYFTSEYGNGTITGKKSGAVIDHIYEEDLLKLPIPKLDDMLVGELYEFYLSVKSKRENADILIKQARALTCKYNNLPALQSIKIQPFATNCDVEISISSLTDFTNDWRLDANFYNPTAKVIEELIKKTGVNYSKLADVCIDIRMSPLFVRNFVEEEYGTKYIAGKHIGQIRKEFKYISNTETEDIEEHILHAGWTLMTCAGTIGKCGYVNEELEGAAAQDIMRIIPNQHKINGEYMYAWLSSDYGKELAKRQRYGAVVDRISPEQTGEILIPLPSKEQQKEIGDLVHRAYALRAESIKLEDEAQKLLSKELTK